MKIELKRIEFNERLSDETNCFVADMYINGKRIGRASNRGDGDTTDYLPDRKEGWAIISEAVAYCKTLPPQKADFGGELLEFKMDLSTYLDDLADRYRAIKALSVFNQKIKSRTGKGIVYLNPDHDFLVLRFKCDFSDITNFKIWKEELVNNVRSTIKPVRINGAVVYTTNMPEDMCRRAGLRPARGLIWAEARMRQLKTSRGKGRKL